MKKTAFTLLAALALTSGVHAQLLSYDVNGTINGASPTATAATGVTGSALTRGSTLAISAANNAFASTNFNNTSNTADFTTATGKYIDFTITPASGSTLNLTSLQFAINGSNTAPNQGQWAYSLDGGNTFTLGTTANGGQFTIAFAGPTTLQTWAFAAFSTTNTVDFRFAAYGTTNVINNGVASANGGSVRIFNIASSNDLVLNGTVTSAVPEPKTAAILVGATALLGLVIFRRNRAA